MRHEIQRHDIFRRLGTYPPRRRKISMPTTQPIDFKSVISPTFRFYLRERTQPAHRRLDSMIGPIETPERYRAFVGGSYAHRLAVEAYLGSVSWPGALQGWRPTRIAPLIALDLVDLGLDEPAIEPLALSNDMSCAIGVAYVLEGSALGARLIARMAAGLGFDELHGARHLAGQERGLGNWRAFTSLIEEADSIDRHTAAAAASATFEHALRSMKNNGFC